MTLETCLPSGLGLTEADHPTKGARDGDNSDTGDGLYKRTLFLHSNLLLYFISCYERCFHFGRDKNG